MPFDFIEIDRVYNISKDEFIKKYYKPQKPVVIEGLINDWAAHQKWNFDYIKSIVGDKMVPLYDNEPVKAEDGFNEPKITMRMADYIDLLQEKPTDLRIFLFNLIKEFPELQQDFSYPKLGLSFMKGLPMMFFGGKNSHVFMHYDIDLANIFHFHFQGKKECLLVPPNQTKYMYKIPFSVICREDIDFDNPDFNQFPLLKNIKPFKTEINHGDTLYIPEGYWHYMKYITPGFSMSLRSIAKNPSHFLEAIYNVFIMRNFDSMMRKIKGNRWIEYKNHKAINS